MTSIQLSTTNSNSQLQVYKPEIIQDKAREIVALSESGKLTISSALEDKQVSYYHKESGAQACGIILSAWVKRLAEKFKIKAEQNLNGEDLTDIAQTLLNEYWFLKFAEIKVFLDGFLLGKYGKPIFDRLDQQTFFLALNDYCQKRDIEIARAREQKHKEELPRDVSDYDPKVSELIRETINELKRPKAAEIAAVSIPLDEEAKQQKNFSSRAARLFYWFPNEMNSIMELVSVKASRFKKPTTSEQLLSNRKVQKLEAIILERTKP